MSEPRQLDFVCLNCPLSACDEGSLFCAFRWATEPNEAQREVLAGAERLSVPRPVQITRLPPVKMKLKVTVKRIRRRHGPADRTQYWKNYHQQNREAKNAKSRQRYAERKEKANAVT